jgi:hypothetical protein
VPGVEHPHHRQHILQIYRVLKKHTPHIKIDEWIYLPVPLFSMDETLDMRAVVIRDRCVRFITGHKQHPFIKISRRCTTGRWYMTIDTKACCIDDVTISNLRRVVTNVGFELHTVNDGFILSDGDGNLNFELSVARRVIKDVQVSVTGMARLADFLEEDFGIEFRLSIRPPVDGSKRDKEQETHMRYLIGNDLYNAIDSVANS